MNSNEKLCLQWNDFKENVTASFAQLRADSDLTDVTLACEDGQQIEAHKVILAASSPLFMDILKRNKHPHPLIYMRGLKSDDVLAIMDFLYFGEANVFQENLDNFLSLAEELKLKGLSGTDLAPKEPESSSKPAANKNLALKEEKLGSKFDRKTTAPGGFGTTVAVDQIYIDADQQNLDQQIQSMITKSDISTGNGQGKLATCNICGKQASFHSMANHVEANHITGVSHSCEVCGKTSRSVHGLRQHKTKYHINCPVAGLGTV